MKHVMLSNYVSFCTLCVVRERYSCEFVQQGGEVHSIETSRCESRCGVKLCEVSVICVCSKENMKLCVICTVHVGDKGSRYD